MTAVKPTHMARGKRKSKYDQESLWLRKDLLSREKLASGNTNGVVSALQKTEGVSVERQMHAQ